MHFHGKIFFCFHFRFFSNEVMLVKAIFIHLFSHFLDHEINLRYFPNQKCHDSNHENSCNDSSKSFLRHKLLSDIIWTIIYIQTTSDYFSFEPMDQPCASETWSRPQSGWPKKIQLSKNNNLEGMQILWGRRITLIPNNIRSSWWPRVSYQEIFTDWITKEPKPYWI